MHLTSMGRNALTCSHDRTASGMTGPLPLMTSNSILWCAWQHERAQVAYDGDDIVSCGCKAHPSAGSGVRMSENMMTPSGLKARHGWRWWTRCVGGQLVEL